MVIDASEWKTHHPRMVYATAFLNPGMHLITVEYFERDQRAQVQLNWSCADVVVPVPPVIGPAPAGSGSMHLMCVPRWTARTPWWVAVFRASQAVFDFNVPNNGQVRHGANPNGVWAAADQSGLRIPNLQAASGGTDFQIVLGYGGESLQQAINWRGIETVRVRRGQGVPADAFCN